MDVKKSPIYVHCHYKPKVSNQWVGIKSKTISNQKKYVIINTPLHDGWSVVLFLYVALKPQQSPALWTSSLVLLLTDFQAFHIRLSLWVDDMESAAKDTENRIMNKITMIAMNWR